MLDGCGIEVGRSSLPQHRGLLCCRPPAPALYTHVQRPSTPIHMRTHTRTHRHLATEDRREFYNITVRASLTDRAPSVTQFFRVRARYDPTGGRGASSLIPIPMPMYAHH